MLISQAWAQAPAAASTGPDWMSFLPIALMFVVLYFLMIRPQAKKAKEHRTLLESLQKGDEVVTAGGELGRVAKVSEGYLGLEVAEGVVVYVQKTAVQTVLPKGTLKSIA